jgi:ABC-2 type transport system ATP-binding protein
MIDVSHLSKLYGDLKAVNDFSFHVGRGEVVGLIGPNGAGKTSTLRCIVGIQAPSLGTVTIDGHDIVRDPIEAKRRLAFMADEPQLFEYLTVMEHLRLTARIYRVADVQPRAAALIAELQLTGKENALPSELSRGMKQKVAIACGLIHDPSALLFDEPLTGLDPLGIRHMKETILSRGKSGAAVIVSRTCSTWSKRSAPASSSSITAQKSRMARSPSSRPKRKWRVMGRTWSRFS